MRGDENLGRWLLDAGRDPDAVAIVDAQGRVTRAELALRARAAAAFIRARLGATPAPVLVVGDASVELCAAYLGALIAGATVVPLAPRDDVATVARQTEAGLVLGAGHVAFADASADPVDAPDVVAVADTALVLYTSGSTGQPKGVELSHRNIVASTEAILQAAPLTASDRTLSVLPLHYCYGLSVLHTHLRAGATLVVGGSEFPEAVVDRLHAERITGVIGVPSMFQILVRRSTLLERIPSDLRRLMVSGGRSDPEIVEALRRALPRAAITLRYGVTEATSAVSCLEPAELERRGCSIGRGLPGLPLRVERPDGSLVKGDEVGEIVVHGDHVARGYLGDPEETARVFVDGTFRTGDLARLDAEGYAYIVGRTREFVKTAGHRVAPEEVELVLAQLAGVIEVAVHGIPHAVRGEALAAVFVAHPSLTRADVQRFCATRLPGYKVPVELRRVSELPRGPNGKILRARLPGLGESLE